MRPGRNRILFTPAELKRIDALDKELRRLTQGVPRGTKLQGRAAEIVEQQRVMAAMVGLRESTGGATSH